MNYCGNFYHEENEDDMHMIEERLYLGNFDSTFNEQRLRSVGITHILGLMDSFKYSHRLEGITYMQIEISDFPRSNILQHVPNALSFISQSMQTGKVLVHCQMGVSRSASIVTSYVMVSRSLEFKHAIELIRQCRPCVSPNSGFQKQLTSIDINEYKRYLL